MTRTMLFGFVAALSIAGVANVETLSFGAGPANAVVYCKTAGVPRGCVARPVAARPVVYCKRVGVPRGCVVR
ncbi:hypothetical protein DFR50_102182 [Roseiarcus fermentans]|uniref:Uncharacterized protein n=1 Tax=Roseiarcus fermentans TaxID=1473586 RepID=A0A366FUF5_9HYPH|nr:hypothetical protein [Roseiarcus fermentans]RBP17690.1 hypothetical protein DFR50_102182 [Roseiarcus fermentans]